MQQWMRRTGSWGLVLPTALMISLNASADAGLDAIRAAPATNGEVRAESGGGTDDDRAYAARGLGTGYEKEQAVLDEAIARWNTSGLTHYRFRMQQSCFCPPEITAPGLVEVFEGEIVSVEDPKTNEPLSPENYLTVSELFDVVQGAIDFEVWWLSAEYDAVLGYPTAISIDVDEFLVDDTTSYAASELPEPGAFFLELAALAALGALAGSRRALPGARPGCSAAMRPRRVDESSSGRLRLSKRCLTIS